MASGEAKRWLCLPSSASAPSVAREKEPVLPWERTFGIIQHSPTASACGCVHVSVTGSVAVPQGASVFPARPSCSAFKTWAFPPFAPSGSSTDLLTPWFQTSKLDFEFPASRTMREYISITVCYQIYGNLLQQQ